MVRLFYFLLMLIVAPWATAGDGTNPTNFKAVDEELGIFRSGQPGRKEFESLAKRGFRSILNLRNYHSDLKLIRGLELKEFRCGVNTGSVTEKDLLNAVRIVRDAPKPLLIHCWHGSDRTGTVVAAFRIAVQNWEVEKAIAEMRLPENGYHEKIYGNLLVLLRGIDWNNFRKELARPAAAR